MYIPSHFRETDERVLAEFIDAYAFGTLVTVGALDRSRRICRSSTTARNARCTRMSRAAIRSGNTSRPTRTCS